MQAIRFLHSALAQALPTVHSRRLKTLMCCVIALLQGRRLSLTGLDRFMSRKASHYVGRVRNRDLYRNDAQTWLPVKNL